MRHARVRVWSVLTVPLLGIGAIVVLVTRGGAAPELRDRVILAAFLVVVASLAFGAWNAQWVARRIESLLSAARGLAGRGNATPAEGRPAGARQRGESDPLEGLAAELARASSAVSQERREIASRLSSAETRAAECAALLEAVAHPLARATSEVQLPLHILLENHFGDLNENQEEMLQAASAAADRIDLTARQLRRILDLDHGRIALQREAIRPGELLQPVLAIAAARGEPRSVKIDLDVAPTLPFVIADRYLLEEALTALVTAVVDRAAPSSTLGVGVHEDGANVRVELRYAGDAPNGLEAIMARRLVLAQGGTVALAPGQVAIALPMANGPPVQPARRSE